MKFKELTKEQKDSLFLQAVSVLVVVGLVLNIAVAFITGNANDEEEILERVASIEQVVGFNSCLLLTLPEDRTDARIAECMTSMSAQEE